MGVHTFTHVNLANVSAWRQRLELDQTELAIAAATGYTTDLLRPPYSSQVDALSPGGLGGAVERAGNVPRRLHRPRHPGLGQARRGPDRRRRALRGASDGAVVMMHDGGETAAPDGRRPRAG